MIKPYLLLLIWIQSYGNIQSSSFGLTVKIFGLMVFVYSVVQFPSNDPFSFCSTSGLKASWVCQMQSPLLSAQNFEEEETQKKNCTRLKVRCQQRFQSAISGLRFQDWCAQIQDQKSISILLLFFSSSIYSKSWTYPGD